MKTDTNWMVRAACAKDPSLFDAFFPSQEQSSREKYSTARRICMHCPVKTPCVAYAISEDISHGMWGGMTRNERRRLTPGQKREIFEVAREEVKNL